MKSRALTILAPTSPRFSLLAAACLLALPGCQKADSNEKPAAAKPAETHAGPATAPHGATGQGQAAEGQAAKGPGVASGEVLETMDSGGYTYVKVKSADGEVWAAAPTTTVSVGDKVSFSGGMAMPGFRSNTLNRSFDMIYFVGGLTINGTKPAMPKAAGAKAASGEGATVVQVKDIKKADKTVAEIYSEKDSLVGKEIAVRGKVVKYNGGILGTNWLHIVDGSGAAGTNDLTVTSQGIAKVGDTVVVRGKVARDKDFGAGYKYELLIEDATLTVE